MLDTVTQCKTKLDDLNAKYQEMIDSSLKKIDQNENVDASIKRQLREQFKMEMEREERIEPRNRPTGERSIRLLVKSLDRLFATNPQPLTPALDVKECIDDVSCELLNF